MFRRTRCPQRLFIIGNQLPHNLPTTSPYRAIAAAPRSSSPFFFSGTSTAGLFSPTPKLLTNDNNNHNNNNDNVEGENGNNHDGRRNIAKDNNIINNNDSDGSNQAASATMAANRVACSPQTYDNTSWEFLVVQEIFKKMQDPWQASQKQQQPHQDLCQGSAVSDAAEGDATAASSPSRENWERLHELFTDLEKKLELDNKPPSFDEKRLASSFAASPLSLAVAPGAHKPEAFLFPRVFLSLGLWVQQVPTAVARTGDNDTQKTRLMMPQPPHTADGLDTILRMRCLWLRDDLADDHYGARVFRYWRHQSFSDFIKGFIFPEIFKSLK